MIKAVFFDWSGTLCDDHTDVFTIIKKTYISPRIFRWLLYNRVSSMFRYGVTKSPFRIKLFYPNVSSTTHERYTFFPNTKEILRFLKQRNILVGIISLQSTRIICQSLHENDLARYVTIIEGGMFHKGVLLSKHMKQLHFLKNEVLFITDLSEDIKEVKGRAIICAATWGYDSKEILLRNNPDRLLTKLTELKTLIYQDYL